MQSAPCVSKQNNVEMSLRPFEAYVGSNCYIFYETDTSKTDLDVARNRSFDKLLFYGPFKSID